MKIVLAGGSGFIGKHLAEQFRSDCCEVVFLTRSPEKPDEFFWDGETLGPWASQLEGAHAVINLAGKSIASKMTEENKRDILSSRVQSTTVIGKAIRQCENPPKVWVNANAMGYYGDRADEVLTEDSPAGTGFLAEVSKAWEEPLWKAETPNTRKVSLRIGFVLARDGGALPVFKKLTKAFLGGSMGSGKQWVSWIHLEDLVRLFAWSVAGEASGPYNATAPNPVRNSEFMETFRSVLHRPWSPPAPAFVLRALGKVMAPDPSLSLISARVLPAKAQKEGFTFRHSELRPALVDLLNAAPKPDRALFEAMDASIEDCLSKAVFGDFEAHFIKTASKRDARMHTDRTVPAGTLRDLFKYADGYFDAFNHAFPDYEGKSWEEARAKLDEMRARAKQEIESA